MIRIADDGRGINPARVLKRAVGGGILPAAQASGLTREEVLQLVFVPGLSTREEATVTSGRGIGLDVVRDIVERGLGGDVAISSQAGQGTQLVARIPRADAQAAAPRLRWETNLPQARAIESRLGWPHDSRSPDALIADCSSFPKLPSSPVVVLLDATPHPDALHRVDPGDPLAVTYLRRTLTALRCRGRPSAGGLDACLWPGSPLRALRLAGKSSRALPLLREAAGALPGPAWLLDQLAQVTEGLACFLGDGPSLLRFGADPECFGVSLAAREEAGRITAARAALPLPAHYLGLHRLPRGRLEVIALLGLRSDPPRRNAPPGSLSLLDLTSSV